MLFEQSKITVQKVEEKNNNNGRDKKKQNIKMTENKMYYRKKNGWK